ncbi:MAG: DUF1292 domain-containing protein [Ruminococcaceae bacterium]|nr:DUF1292 domain-containing protein [Oscillospiraceae bacterium]
MKKKSFYDQIMDENDNDPIVLYGENGAALTFEQIAVIPDGEHIYVLLCPVDPIPGVGADEGLVFELCRERGEDVLHLVVEDAIIDRVFAEYDTLLRENSDQEE